MNKKTVSAVYIPYFKVVIILLTLLCTYSESTFSSEISTKDTLLASTGHQTRKKLAYIVSDINIPFWSIMGRGIKGKADSLGYDLSIYSADNKAKNELESVVLALKDDVSGIIVSPTNSSACTTILKLAKKAGVPVVISDIGTDSGDYIAYISSDNKEGAYQIGKILARKMHSLGWGNGSVGIIAIPQKRLNGQLRTEGFMLAMGEAGIKSSDMKQQSSFTYKETYDYAKVMIQKHPDLRAIFIQGSDKYQGVIDAISEAGKTNKILLISFDAEPVFLDFIPKGIIVGAAMQQPYLMGEKAVYSMDKHLQGKKVKKHQQLSVLAISTENIAEKLSVIKRNVLGILK
jgi:ribose transport system substrate-binding protein